MWTVARFTNEEIGPRADAYVAFTVPGSDAFPVDMFHLRRGLVGGTLARHWLAWTDADGPRVLDIAHGGSSADPTAFVPSLALATRTPVSLSAGPQTPAEVAEAIVLALVADDVDASRDGATVTIQGPGVRDLVIPPAVDMTDTSLRGMWGGQRDDWGEGTAADLNDDGGTGGTGSVHLGALGQEGRILGVYLWTRTDTVATVVRLAASTGPAYDPAPGAMTPLMQGVATIDGFGGTVQEAVAVADDDVLWAQYRSDTATAGIRFRTHASTPVGRGQLGADEVLVWDTTASASSGTAFGGTYTPTADATFAIYVMIGVVWESPDAEGNYPANGSLAARIGDQNPDPEHGTQLLVAPEVIDGETTHHRGIAPQWTNIGIVSATRTIGALAAGEDSRAAIYSWPDNDLPSSEPATLVSDLGPMGLVANTASTLTLPERVEIGTEVLGANTVISLGFNYCTASGAALATMVLPVFIDDTAGDSGWLDCWHDERGAWHDDIRGANNYAFAAGITEYRTRVSEGNVLMPTTILTEAWPAEFQTDPSDDSPSAIALDWIIVNRVGFVAA